MVESMRSGSVIVDLAAEQGGNCALTEPGRVVVKQGVSIIGYTDFPSRLPTQSSQLYGANLVHLLRDLCKENNGQIVLDMEDDVVRTATVIKDGEITWPPPPLKTPAIAPPKPAAEVPVAPPMAKAAKPTWGLAMLMAVAGLLLAGLGGVSPPAFLAHFTVFVLACFIGYMVVWNVSPALHTPLMSVTNAISGIIVIGALLQISSPEPLVWILAAVAVLIATVNIFGGFFVTQRMLQMFRK
jgi:NAD(P) transhydrogenase subunit alpha